MEEIINDPAKIIFCVLVFTIIAEVTAGFVFFDKSKELHGKCG